MPHKVYLGAGALCAGGLSVALIVAVATEAWSLAAAAVAVLLSAILLLAIDANRRVRGLRSYIRREMAREPASNPPAATPAHATPAHATPPPVSEGDVVGSVRLLQAQYVGRLDRMQTQLDAALAATASRAGPGLEQKGTGGSPR